MLTESEIAALLTANYCDECGAYTRGGECCEPPEPCPRHLESCDEDGYCNHCGEQE